MATLELTLDTVIDEESGRTLRDAVVDEAVEKLSSELTQACRQEAIYEAKRQASVIAAVETRKKVTEIVQSTMLEETDRWGNRRGTPGQTWQEFIAAQVKAYINEPCNSRGDTSGYGSEKNLTRIGWMISEEIGKAFKVEWEKIVAAVEKDFRDKLAAKIAQHFKEAAAKAMEQFQ